MCFFVYQFFDLILFIIIAFNVCAVTSVLHSFILFAFNVYALTLVLLRCNFAIAICCIERFALVILISL